MKRIPRAGDILKIVRTRQQDSTTINSCWLPPTESREYVYSALNGGGTWYVLTYDAEEDPCVWWFGNTMKKATMNY